MSTWGTGLWENDETLDIFDKTINYWFDKIKNTNNINELLSYTALLFWFFIINDLPKYLYEEQIMEILNFARHKIIKLNKEDIINWHDQDERNEKIDEFLSRIENILSRKN